MTVTTNRARINLAGSWALVFDHDGQGVNSGWGGSHYPNDLAETVTVPEIWNITYPGTDGIGFYQTRFTLPANWQDKSVEIVFEGVSYLTTVWVNGKYVGSHEGAYTPFRFDITTCLRAFEENELVVRVSSLSQTRAVDGIELKKAPAAKQSWNYTFGGIWGNVYLEALPKLACHSVKLTPDLQQQLVHIDLTLQNALPVAHQADVELTVISNSNEQIAGQTSRVNIPPGTSLFTFHVSIPSPQRWTCQNPVLYRLKTEVFDPATNDMDIQETSFGIREFTMREGQFFLNGEPIYLRGVLLQPDYPITLTTPPDKGMMEKEIRLVKEAGFNLIRTHLRPAAPGFLDLADEMGILVYAETSLGWIRDSPRMMEHGLRETEALIDRDYNHPSIVFWGIYNENPPAASFNGQALSSFARSLDTTRVVVNNSGGSMAIDQDFGWIERAWVLPAYETAPQRAIDIHLYLGCYPTRPTYEWLRSVGTNATPAEVLFQQGFGSPAVLSEFEREMHSFRGKVFVSEIGCGGFTDLEKTAAGFGDRENLLDARMVISLRDSLYQGFRQRGLEKVFGSIQNLLKASQEMQSRGITRQVEAILTNPGISGFIITQLNDASWELEAGILDLWRNPKPAYYALKRLNQSHCLITAPHTTSLNPGGSTWIEVSLLNQAALDGTEQIVATIQNKAGDRMTRQLIQPVYPTGLHQLERIKLEASEGKDSYHIDIRLIRGQEVICEASETIHCLPRVQWDDNKWKISLWGSMPPLLRGDDNKGFPEPGVSAKPDGQVMLAGLPSEITTEDWENILQAAGHGSKVIIGALTPEDKIACNALRRAGIPIELHMGYGSWIGCHHWLPKAELTENIPDCGGLAGELFTGILPRYILTELGGYVLAGSIRCSQNPDLPKTIGWRSDIEQVSFGKGKLIFCQYRLFEQAYSHPVASQMAYNLIKLVNHA